MKRAARDIDAIIQELDLSEAVHMRVKTILQSKVLVENGAAPWSTHYQKEIGEVDGHIMKFDLAKSSLGGSQEMPVQKVETKFLSEIL